MPLGGEGTHGRTDRKEGIYFGPEHSKEHPLIGLPLHGQNQFPDEAVPNMRPTVLEYIAQITELGKTVTDAISLSFELDPHFIRDNYLQPEPVALFRCFKYVPRANREGETDSFGIGEHSGEKKKAITRVPFK